MKHSVGKKKKTWELKTSDVPFSFYTSSYTSFKLSPMFLSCTEHSCPCFSLSERQHLRKTHQRPQHDDVMCRQPTASRPVHRWQCCTSNPNLNPVNPVPHKQWHTHFEFMESHWITAIIDSCVSLLFFCPLCATKICTWGKKKKAK